MAIVQRLPEWLRERYPWYIQTFNVGEPRPRLARRLGRRPPRARARARVRATSRGRSQAITAAAVFVGLNHFVLAAMLRLARGHTFRESELFGARALATALVLAGLGVALAALWRTNPWVVPAVDRAARLVAPLVRHPRAPARERGPLPRDVRVRAASAPRSSSLDRRVVTPNRALERTLGYTAEELVALPIEHYSEAADDIRDRELFAELVEGKRDHYELEKRYRTKNGRPVSARLAVSLVRDADGRPKFGIGMVEDTTERKRAEESLRASEERYRELFENANDMVFTLDLDGRFTAINRAGERITGPRRAPTCSAARSPSCSSPGARRAGCTRRTRARTSARSSAARAAASRSRSPRGASGSAAGRSASRGSPATSASGARSRSSCARPRRWRRSASSPAASPTTSTTC